MTAAAKRSHRRRWVWIGLVAGTGIVLLGAGVWLRGRGVSAIRSPFPGEERIARAAWRFLVPASSRDAVNPVADTPEVREHALEHFADHCAICHANNGSGDTTMGRRTFPPAPDLRARRTQDLTDGELFYAIEQGIPWTAMPAWTTGTDDGARESWELVRFIRHLPAITPEELTRMEALNPRSPAQENRDKEIDEFLRGGTGAVSPEPNRNRRP
jgi:mono/diheme cytochrome c family protein